MHFTIKQPETEIEFKQYYHLRWKILRAPWNQPEGSEIDSIENLCFHIMATNDNNVIAIARLQFNSDTEAQVRYMAVAKEFEGKGIGSELLKALEFQAKSSARKTIVLDARESAVQFYEKKGYKVIEKSYLLFDAIQHYKMSKSFKKNH